MNELQQVLLVIAVVVIGALYFISKRKNLADQTQAQTRQKQQLHQAENQVSDASARASAQAALNDLAEPHIPVSQATENRLLNEEEVIVVPENQERLPFEEPELEDKPKHIVIEDPDMVSVREAGVPAEEAPVTFGRPENANPVIMETTNRVVEKTEPESFVIVVMSTGSEFSMKAVQHALLGVGLEYSAEQLYIKKDSMGNTIITVANLLEPGTFPAENLEQFTTPGVVLILQLPTTVRAPAAMHDLIMMSRKISQRLNGRLYNAERQLLKESDLQAMRDAAIAYESAPA